MRRNEAEKSIRHTFSRVDDSAVIAKSAVP